MGPLNQLREFLVQKHAGDADQWKPLITEIEKDYRKSAFALDRLKEDKKITEGFLNESIKDLEEITSKLKASQADFELQIERMPIGHIVWSPDFKVLSFNAAAEKIFGFKAEEVIGKHPYGSIVPAEIQEMVDQIWQRLLQGDTTANSINENLTKTGEVIICDWANTPLRNSEGMVTSVLSMVSDITKQQENERKLKVSEERLNLAFLGAGDGMWDWDIVNNTVYYSPNWEKMFGYEVGTAPQNLEAVKSRTHPVDFPKMFAEVTRYLNREIPTYSYEFRMFNLNGQLMWTLHRAVAMFDKDGNATRMIGTTADITRLKESEALIREAKENAEQANRLKSEFLANMSHEIRTPMNAILGFSEILSSTTDLEEQEKYKEYIRQAGKNLSSLIDDILDLSKIEAGKIEICPQTTELKKFLDEINKLFVAAQKPEDVSFSFSISGKISEYISIDDLRLRQVLNNLLSNAAKFTEKGTISLQVDLSDDHRQIVFMVSDTGIGIEDDQQNLIFDSFRQQDGQSTRKYGGTGLGLTISKRLVQLMGGDIEVHSQVGVGSVFSVALPYVPEKRTIKKNGLQDDKYLRKTRDETTILIVEDNVANRLLLRKMLERIDSKTIVVEAEDGREAVTLAKERSPDLIFMDLMMPNIDGYTANQMIKEDYETADIPVIAWTAKGMYDEETKILNEFDGILRKPSPKSQVKDIIANFL